MNTRMDKYREEREMINSNDIPKRSDKNKELYRQVYNAYDEFENLIVPSNVKEIDLDDLKKEVTNRSDYHRMKEYHEITSDGISDNNKIIRKERVKEQQRQENEIYDIKELLNKAVSEKGDIVNTIEDNTHEDYLKKLKLDNIDRDIVNDGKITNIELIKDMYDDQVKEFNEEIENSQDNEELMETANLSLEILSDLKSDNEGTRVSAPIKEDELPDSIKKQDTFYSSTYKFNKKDFLDKEDNVEEDFYDNEMNDKGNGKFFLKILLLLFGLSLIIVIGIYIYNYFNE